MGDSYVMLSGVAWHKEKANVQGEPYRSFIPGLGYHYKFRSFSCTAIIVNDSNGNVMPSVTIGKTLPIINHLSIGLELGLTSRVVLSDQDTSYSYRKMLPLALPKIEFLFDRLILNMAYIPHISSSYININEAVYINGGIKF